MALSFLLFFFSAVFRKIYFMAQKMDLTYAIFIVNLFFSSLEPKAQGEVL